MRNSAAKIYRTGAGAEPNFIFEILKFLKALKNDWNALDEELKPGPYPSGFCCYSIPVFSKLFDGIGNFDVRDTSSSCGPLKRVSFLACVEVPRVELMIVVLGNVGNLVAMEKEASQEDNLQFLVLVKPAE